MMKKGQVSTEFLVVASFMFLLFSALFFTMQNRIAALEENQNYQKMQEISNVVTTEVSVAYGVGPGYRREFTLPQTLQGSDYSINIEGGRDLVIEFRDLQHIAFLEDNVQGSISKGKNVVKNVGGTVKINP